MLQHTPDFSEKGLDLGAFLRTVLDCVAQPVWVVDHAGVIRFANPAAIAALGYDELSELRGKPSHETIHYKHPDGSPFPVEDCPMLLPRTTGETIHRDEDWFIRRNGSMFPVSYWSAPIELPNGQGAVVAFTDIEESRRAEQALREHDAILAAVEQPVYLTEDGVIRYINPAGVRAMGYDDASEMQGNAGHWLLHYKRPDGLHYPIEDCPLHQAAIRGESLSAEEDWWVRKDGSMIPVSYRAVPLEIPGGTGLVVAFTDVSERRAAERVARERDIAEARGAELAASRARVVAATAKERRRVVRDLHDGAQQRLVHAVVTLKLAAQQLGDGGGQVQELVGEALEQAEKATFELRELTHGILPRVLTSGGLHAGVDELASRSSLAVNAKVSPERFPPAIEATAYFVVSEALTNAVKYSGAQRAEVRAKVEENTLRVEVRDDGVGGADPARGSGLTGLRDRVEAVGGTIEIVSPSGRGTSLAVEIPIDER